MPEHEFLCENLAALDACRRSCGPKYAQTLRLEAVHDTHRKRNLRPNDSHVHAQLSRRARQAVQVGVEYGNVLGDCRRAGVAGRYVQGFHERAAAQFPGDGVLPRASSDYQHLHRALPEAFLPLGGVIRT